MPPYRGKAGYLMAGIKKAIRFAYLVATLGSVSSARWVMDYEKEEGRPDVC